MAVFPKNPLVASVSVDVLLNIFPSVIALGEIPCSVLCVLLVTASGIMDCSASITY